MGWGRGGDPAEGPAGPSTVDGRPSHIRKCQRCGALKPGLAKGVRQRLGREGARL